ncbi:hypothetical protein [Streptomyces sp. NPDC048191]|uniref:hypothetical protein n=1 Tax=Streptomyces sp. NPDC048191 TaxID=3155484 RepID=UPI0033F9F280
MAVDQLPDGVRRFANYLDGLLGRLDQGGGWSGVFWQRDPDGMRACLDGREVPPWDVVQALLEDLAAAYGPAAAGAERERARALYRAALTAYDARPGARDTLLDRLDVMLREQRYAAERQAELTRLLSTPSSAEEAGSLHLDLAWAQDDHDRATARCAELRARLTELDRSGAARADGLRPGGEPASQGAGGEVLEASGRGYGAFAEASGPGYGVFAEASAASRHTGRDRAQLPPESAPHRTVPRGEPTSRRQADPKRRPAGPVSEAPHARAPHPVTPTPAPAPPPGADPAAQAFPSASGATGASQAGSASPGVDGAAQAFPSAFRGSRDFQVGSASPGADGAVQAFPSASGGTPAAQAAPPSPDGVPDAHAPASPRDAGRGAEAGSPPLRAPHVPQATAPPGSRTLPGEHQASAPLTSPPEPAPPAKPRKRRRGSARFAGMVDDVAGPSLGAPPAVPEAPARRTPRGARFAGAAEAAEPAAAPAEVADAEAGTAAEEAVEQLARLRGEGRSGEAHVLLVEVVQWPAGRFPALADALHRAGLGADWATLLWEAASLPAERLVAVAAALAAAGRDADGQQLLRQGVARPAEQIGAAVLRLEGAGHGREAAALLDACVRVRTAEEAARSVAPDPRRLVPLLLRAARAVSDERHWDLVHALRVAGHAT